MIKNLAIKLHARGQLLKSKLKEKDGGGDYVSTGVKALIGVVIGALLLYGLYTLFEDTILVTLKEKVQNMFEHGHGADY